MCLTTKLDHAVMNVNHTKTQTHVHTRTQTFKGSTHQSSVLKRKIDSHKYFMPAVEVETSLLFPLISTRKNDEILPEKLPTMVQVLSCDGGNKRIKEAHKVTVVSISEGVHEPH